MDENIQDCDDDDEGIPRELRRFVWTRRDVLAMKKPRDPVKQAAFEKEIMDLRRQLKEEDRFAAASAGINK